MKKTYIVALCAIMAFSMIASVSMAAESAKDTVKDIVTYPVKVVGKSAEAIGSTAKEAVSTVYNTTESVVKGDAQGMVTEPVKGTAETAKTAVVETANVPVEAAK